MKSNLIIYYIVNTKHILNKYINFKSSGIIGGIVLQNYKVECKCGFNQIVRYGKISKDEIYEIFSCKKCNNLFTLRFDNDRKCFNCSGTELVAYNPHKIENLNFYKEMYDKKNIEVEKLTELNNFWDTIEFDKCPKCKNHTLKWIQIQDI